MKVSKRTLFLTVAASLVAVITAIAAFQPSKQDNHPNLRVPPGTPPERVREFRERLNRLPLADYDAPEPADPEQAARRRRRNRAYNRSNTREYNRLRWVELGVINNDWELGLESTLPVAQSSAVLVGEVTEARAFVSEDHTAVYSEFIVRVEEILKNDSHEPLTIGDHISTERLGGRVRLQQGQVSTYVVSGQFMPEIGKRYVFFLGYNPREAGPREAAERNRRVLTAYELRAGRVFPLDSAGGRNFKEHENKESAAFLSEIRRAIANSSQAPLE